MKKRKIRILAFILAAMMLLTGCSQRLEEVYQLMTAGDWQMVPFSQMEYRQHYHIVQLSCVFLFQMFLHGVVYSDNYIGSFNKQFFTFACILGFVIIV